MQYFTITPQVLNPKYAVSITSGNLFVFCDLAFTHRQPI